MKFEKNSLVDEIDDLLIDFHEKKLSELVIVDFYENKKKSESKKEYFKERERIQKKILNSSIGKDLMKDSGGLILCKQNKYDERVAAKILDLLKSIDGDWKLTVDRLDFERNYKVIFYLFNYWNSRKIKQKVDKVLKKWQANCKNTIYFKTVKYGRYLRPVYYFIEKNQDNGWCKIFQMKMVWNAHKENFILETKTLLGKADKSRISNYKDADKNFICDNKILNSENIRFKKNPPAITYTQSKVSGIERLDRLNCLILFKKSVSEAFGMKCFNAFSLENKDWHTNTENVVTNDVMDKVGIRFKYSEKTINTSVDGSSNAKIAGVIIRSALVLVNNYIDQCNRKMKGRYKWPNLVENENSRDCLYVTSREETRSNDFYDEKFEFSEGFNQSWILDVTPSLLRSLEMTEEDRQAYLDDKDGSKQNRLFSALFEFARRAIEKHMSSLIDVKEAHGAIALKGLFSNPEEREKEWAMLMQKITDSETKEALRIALGSADTRGELKFKLDCEQDSVAVDSLKGCSIQNKSFTRYIVGTPRIQIEQVSSELLTPVDNHGNHASTNKKYENDSIARVSGYTIEDIGRKSYKIWMFFPSMFLGIPEKGRWNKARLFKVFKIKADKDLSFESVDQLAKKLLTVSQYYPKQFKAGSCAQGLVFDYLVKNTIKQKLRND